MKQLVIIDENLINKSGHNYDYNKSVWEIFTDHGYQVSIYANELVIDDIQNELHTKNTLVQLDKNSFWIYIPLVGKIINRCIFWVKIYAKIQRIYNEFNKETTTFFFTNISWLNFLPAALAIRKSGTVKNILLLRTSIREHIGISKQFFSIIDWIYNFCFNLLEKCNVLYTTDSDVIAREVNLINDLDVVVLPIPHLNCHLEFETIARQTNDPFKLYAPGTIREEKGIHFIIDAMRKLIEDFPTLKDELIFQMQYDSRPEFEKLNNEIRLKLKALPIRIEEYGSLSTQEYNLLLSNADIILIPYDPNQGYRFRTSGILAETIAYEKPFITTKDTWMEIQASKYNTGICIMYNNTVEFTQAIQFTIKNYSFKLSEAKSAKSKWVNFHNKLNFYKITTNLK